MFPFHPIAFFVPPRKEIFETDSERRHAFDAALREYSALLKNYERFRYRCVIVSKPPVPKRADFVLRTL